MLRLILVQFVTFQQTCTSKQNSNNKMYFKIDKITL